MPRTDEIVPDSEGEEDLASDLPTRTIEPERATRQMDGRTITDIVSSIQTANTTIRRVPSEMTTISNDTGPSRAPLTTASSTIINAAASSDAPNPKPRPKPRPAYKGAPKTTPSSDVQTPFTAPVAMASTIEEASSSKPRPQPRPAYRGAQSSDNGAGDGARKSSSAQPEKAKSTNNDLDLIEIYSQDIAERAKMRSRSRSGGKPSPLGASAGVIELSDDDEDELSFLGPNKSKSRDPSPPKKRTKTVHTAEGLAHTRTHPSPPAALGPAPVSLTPLPPSDPPSTATLPIASQSPVRPIDIASHAPPSSPLPRPAKVPKRKRNIVIPELDDEPDQPEAAPGDAHGGEPLAPPTFFAGSSSLPPPLEDVLPPKSDSSKAGGADSGRTKKAKPKAPSSSTGEGGAAGESSAAAGTKSKPRKKRKADDDDFDLAAEEAAPPSRKKSKKDNDDDDWDGAASKPKRKPPAKKKGKKDKGSADAAGATPSAPKPSRRTKAGKDTQAKSNEFVLDSDGEQELSAAAGITDSAGATRADAGDLGGEAAPLERTKEAPNEDHRLSTSPSKPPSSGPSGKRKKDQASTSLSSASNKSRSKKRALVFSEDEDEEEPVASAIRKDSGGVDSEGLDESRKVSAGKDSTPSKENVAPSSSMLPPPVPVSDSGSAKRSYSISSRRTSTPMSELIRKVNSQPGSPFLAARPAYSPYAKSSKTLLKRIAPLHPNRKTPPPPPPRAPPPKKTKKQLEMEERWEMELEESVEGWYCMSEEERASLRRNKRDMELGVED